MQTLTYLYRNYYFKNNEKYIFFYIGNCKQLSGYYAKRKDKLINKECDRKLRIML